MTRRVAAVFLGLTAALLLLVGVPLGASFAETRTQAMVLDRAGDTARLARLAAPAFAREELATLEPEVRAYGELYGIRVEVRDRNGALLLSAGTALPDSRQDTPQDAAADVAVDTALAGRRAAGSPLLVPWGPGAVVVAEPVLRGTDVAGAVLTVSPTGVVRGQVLGWWLRLTVLGVLALGLAALLTVPLSRWVLRPVRRLDDAVHTITDGDLTARADPGQGPPELRRLVADFNRMAEALRASSAQQRALVADASHQLRNPLAALRLRVDALESALVPGGREDHRLAVGELDRLTRVLDDTLALARAQDGADEPMAVDVRECARSRLRAWSAAAAADDTVLLLEGEGACWVLAPGGALEQVLDALLHNALRFARGGTVVVDVTAVPPEVSEPGAPPAAGGVRLRVADDGPGLTAQQCRSAAQRFWRGPDQQNVPGSGLGLAIAGTLTERCGGVLDLRPAYPCGLEVSLVLPRLAAP